MKDDVPEKPLFSVTALSVDSEHYTSISVSTTSQNDTCMGNHQMQSVGQMKLRESVQQIKLITQSQRLNTRTFN